jgi:uncharacterized protein (DUF433 family)
MVGDERYLDVHAPNDVRIKGTRVGIEQLLSAYLAGNLPEEIAVEFPSVTLEQIHGVIAWYLRNRNEADAYLAEWLSEARRVRHAQTERPQAAVIERLRKLVEARVAQ